MIDAAQWSGMQKYLNYLNTGSCKTALARCPVDVMNPAERHCTALMQTFLQRKSPSLSSNKHQEKENDDANTDSSIMLPKLETIPPLIWAFLNVGYSCGFCIMQSTLNNNNTTVLYITLRSGSKFHLQCSAVFNISNYYYQIGKCNLFSLLQSCIKIMKYKHISAVPICQLPSYFDTIWTIERLVKIQRGYFRKVTQVSVVYCGENVADKSVNCGCCESLFTIK